MNAWRKIGAIARLTWREASRARLVGGAIALWGLAILVCWLFESGDAARPRVLLDLALGLMGGLGALLAIYWGTSLVHVEMDKRTLYVVLAKPVSRFEFLAGKYLGVSLALGTIGLLMSGGLSGLMLLLGQWSPAVLGAALALWVQAWLLAALAFFFATLTSGMLASLYAFGLYLIGQHSLMLRDFALSEEKLNRANYLIGQALYYLLPNFGVFDLKNAVVYGSGLPLSSWLFALLYGLLLAGALLLASVQAWEGRELP